MSQLLSIAEEREEEEEAGNTDGLPPPPKRQKQDTQAYLWCFTAPKKDFNESQISQTLGEYCKKFLFQEELSATGYAHYQGVFSLRTKERMSTVKNIMGKTVHLERCDNWWKSVTYCSKQDTKVAGPWTEKCPPMEYITTLRDWQAEVMEVYKDQKESLDTRTINWVFDTVGNTGKTELVRYIHCTVAGACTLTSGKIADLALALPYAPSVVCFDFTRSLESFIPYQAIEAIKNGAIFSSKYQSGMKMFKKPVIICFANYPPDRSKLSADRWNVMEITGTDMKLQKSDASSEKHPTWVPYAH